MKRKLATTVAVILSLVVVEILALMAVAQEVPKMTKEEVKGMLVSADVVIVDVRKGGDWNGSELKIKGAIREDPGKVSSWIDKYPRDKTLVFYCAWPNEATSASVALKFMDKGYTKVYALKGGWNEWVDANFPTEKK